MSRPSGTAIERLQAAWHAAPPPTLPSVLVLRRHPPSCTACLPMGPKNQLQGNRSPDTQLHYQSQTTRCKLTPPHRSNVSMRATQTGTQRYTRLSVTSACNRGSCGVTCLDWWIVGACGAALYSSSTPVPTLLPLCAVAAQHAFSPAHNLTLARRPLGHR